MSAKVLVVDDSLLVRQQVGRVLSAGGFTIIEAVDGVDAMLKVTASPDIRLIVCDVNMPRMNGIEFLECMKKESKGAGASVVMLTTEGQTELILKAKALGARAWIVKPFKPELLLAAARKLTAVA